MRKSMALETAYRRAQGRQEFIAWDLARFQSLLRWDDSTLAAHLSLKGGDLVGLGLCGSPRRGSQFASDLGLICGKFGVPISALANILRIGDGITALQQAQVRSEQSVLLAARDRLEEIVRPALPPVGVESTPKWLLDAVEAFWGESRPADGYPRDLDLPILLNLPLGIVEIADLSVGQLADWLARFDIDLLKGVEDRALRGCLMAYSGVGLIFVDADDSPAERRETLAHEAGHFISDYLMPRRHIEGHAPELLDVVDGLRPPGESDLLQAVLARVQLGLHLQLIERSPTGGFVSDQSDLSEDSAARIAWEILAPAVEVKRVMESSPGAPADDVLQSRFGLSPGLADEYGNYLAKAWRIGPSMKDWLGLSDGES